MLQNNFILFQKKLIRALQKLAISFVDPLFQDRHPNKIIIKITEMFYFLILKFQPNDRWNLHIFVKEWTKIFLDETTSKKKNILMFSCYRGQFSQDILLAIILAKQGHQITLSYLPKLRSPIKYPLNDSKGVKQYLKYVMKILEDNSGGKITCWDLSEYWESKKIKTNDFKNQAYSDTVMMLQKENINFNKKIDKQTYQYCLERLCYMHNSISNFIKNKSNYDLCLVANGASFENSEVLKRAKKLSIPFNTYEKFAFKNARTITHEGPFHEFFDLDILLKLLKSNKYIDNKIRNKVKEKAHKLLLERKNSTGNHWSWEYQKNSAKNISTKNWLLQNTKNKKYVLICPNVPFDAGYGSLNLIFESMKQWLLDTIRFILKNSNLIIIVRAHPAEDRESFGNEKTDLIIKKSDINSRRLIVIPSSSNLNTYELMENCTFSSVYSSTTGVELAMFGKLVVSGANIYHSRVGVTKRSTDLKSYFKKIKSFINNKSKQSSDDIYKAYLVYFIFHFVLQMPYPYDKPSMMAQKPINKFFYNDDFSKYDLTFKLLAMDKKEYTDFFKKRMNTLMEVWS